MRSFPAFRSLVSLALLTLLMPAVQAADIELALPIKAVKVYPAGAEITRSGSQILPGGTNQLVFAGLPAGLDPARLELRIDSNAVTLGNLQLRERFPGQLVNADEQVLQERLEALKDGRTAITDEMLAAETQLKLLDALATGAGNQQQGINAGELTALLDTLASASSTARASIRDANRRLREQDREIASVQFELEQIQTRQRTLNELTVSVDVAQEVSTQVSLTYPVSQAGWNWLYEARLDTESAALVLQRKVSVIQTTGENWQDVALTITTARPGESTQTPELGSLLVDFLQVMPLRMESSAGVARELVMEDVVATGAMMKPMEVDATQYLVEFQVPGLVTIAADSQPQLLPVDQRSIDTKLATRVVPERDSVAYVEARFRYQDEVPFQGGIMQFYRDGAFIGSREVASWLPQEEISLPFGRDDRVRVTSRPVEEESRDGGVLRRNAVDETRLRYEITSFHNQPVEIEVLGRIPVSRNSEITVEILNGATPADETDLDGSAGVLMWRVNAVPGGTATINHFYRVSYPQDNQLWYQDN